MNEEFQKLVLEELRSIKSDINILKEGQGKLEEGQVKLEEGLAKLEVGQNGFEKKLDAVYDQTAKLIEFRSGINTKLDNLIEDNKSIH